MLVTIEIIGIIVKVVSPSRLRLQHRLFAAAAENLGARIWGTSTTRITILCSILGPLFVETPV